MATLNLVFRKRLTALQACIALLLDGSTSEVFEGKTYRAADLETLYALVERLSVRAAIEAVENGAQSYELNGVVYTRANLATLYQRDAGFAARDARATRGGIGIRYARPGA